MMSAALSLSLALLAATPASAAPARALQCVAAGPGPADALDRLADDMRVEDTFYQQLLKWKGAPAACSGSIGQGDEDGRATLMLSWPDGAAFEQQSLPPETTIVRYGNPNGLDRADEVIDRFRDYAYRHGLRIDWTAPHPTDEAAGHVVEYRDQDPGVNGFVRFVYDGRRRLVAASLSIAL